MHLSEELKDEIKSHSLEETPKECCGLIVYDDDKGKVKAIRCTNQSENKEKHFEISAHDYLRASLSGKILGMYHSHPETTKSFSEHDKYQSDGHKIDSVLYIVDSDEFDIYKPIESNSSFWTKEFKMKHNDCLTVIYDFYKEELGIELDGFDTGPKDIENVVENRDENWVDVPSQRIDYKKVEEMFQKYKSISCVTGIETDGFDPNVLKKYDMLLLDLHGQIYHMAVYLGGESILHHPPKGYPRVESIKRSWKKRVNIALRHKKFL